jgi:hypothetical protein
VNVNLRALPVALIVSYLLFTVGLFYFGPMPWPVSNPGLLGTFLAAAVVGISAFGVLGSTGMPAGSPIASWKPIIVTGAVLSVVVLFPSAYYYADKMPWQIVDAIKDQNAAYVGLQKKLVDTAGTRTIISLMRAITYPVIFAVLPLAILNWRRMTWRLWAVAWLAILSSVVFSILRGTDREIFDLMFIASASMMVLLARYILSDSKRFFRLVFSRSAVICAFGFLIIVALVLNTFADRRVARILSRGNGDTSPLADRVADHAGWLKYMCIRKICLEPDHPLVAHVSVPKQYAVLMLTSYLTQGYYGLSLALTEDFHSTLGLGHSPVIDRLYERLTKPNQFYERGYTYRLRDMDWSDESQWSTIFPWIANDVDFHGSIAVICLLAFLFGRAWRDAVGADNDAAAIVFCLLFQLFVYVPANNQLAQTFDAYFAITGWCAFWLLMKIRRADRAFFLPASRHPHI